MSRRRKLDARLQSYAEIHEILGAMRNLAMLENHRLNSFLQTQQRTFNAMATALSEVLCWVAPQTRPAGPTLTLVIGSERGFCGDFNAAVEHFLATSGVENDKGAALAVVGDRLAARLIDDPRLTAHFSGPTTVDDVPTVLQDITRWIAEHTAGGDDVAVPANLRVVHHSAASESPGLSVFQPFTETRAAQGSHPPRRNLPLPRLLAGLSDHYLFAALNRVFYESLAAENRLRLQHLDAAIQRLDDSVAALRLQRNHLRQEDITNEIEIIMLSETLSPTENFSAGET